MVKDVIVMSGRGKSPLCIIDTVPLVRYWYIDDLSEIVRLPKMLFSFSDDRNCHTIPSSWMSSDDIQAFESSTAFSMLNNSIIVAAVDGEEGICEISIRISRSRDAAG